MDSLESTRWTTIVQAPLGTPCAYLDTFGISTRLASAAIITVPSDDVEHPHYRPIFHHQDAPTQIPRFRTLRSALDWTERQIPPPLTTIPLNIFPQWWVTDRHTPQPSEILISITEPGQPPITPHGIYGAIHHLETWDIPYTINDPKRGTLHPFSESDAHNLIQFLLKHRHRMTALTIHCHAGISRSPAVAIAISEWITTSPFTTELIERFPAFNRTIYRTLCHTALANGLMRS